MRASLVRTVRKRGRQEAIGSPSQVAIQCATTMFRPEETHPWHRTSVGHEPSHRLRGLVARESLDACPLALGSDARVAIEMGFKAIGAGPPVLLENALAPKHADAICSLLVRMACWKATTRSYERCEFCVRRVLESLRMNKSQFHRVGQLAVLTKEVFGAACNQRGAIEGSVIWIHARPFPDLLYQWILDRIGKGVEHLVDDVVGLDEAADTGLFGRPEVLKAAA